MDISKYRDNVELSDVSIIVKDHEYKLHKFPLSINCEYFKEQCKLQNKIVLKDFPGSWNYFELIADHCYGKDVDINEDNVITLLCGAEYLGMEGKYNMKDKCQKVIDRIFRSVEFSKSIELIFPLLESAEKLENTKAKEITDRGISVIVDLWLRHVSNYKSNFKDKYFEDTLIFEELLKLSHDWIERIIDYCSADENKYNFVGKLAVEYIKIHVIGKLKDSQINSLNRIQNSENETTVQRLDISSSSSCSSINEGDHSEKSSVSYEKDTKPEKDSKEIENIGELFDKIVFSLPDCMNLGKIVTVQWLQKCFDVCDKYKCQSKSKLLKLCGGMLTEVSIDEIKMMDPKNITELIEQILKNDKVDKDLMKWIWDNNFLEMAKNDELDPMIFSKVVKNMPETEDLDSNMVFQIVLSILNKICDDNKEYQSDLIECVKLEEISINNLEIAMESKFWKVDEVCKAAIKRLKMFEKDTSAGPKKHDSYRTQYSTYDDTSIDCPSRYRYQSKNISSLKSSQLANNPNFLNHRDEYDYGTSSYGPIDSHYSQYRHVHSSYCPDSYLTMEENLRTELKKISENYVTYYKDRFPLKSKRRYQYTIPYDI